MPRVIAIDPGYAKNGALGWSYFNDYFGTGGLVRRKPEWSPEQMGVEAAQEILCGLASLAKHPQQNSTLFDHIVVEKMKSYAHARQEGDQNDLINLTIVGSVAAGVLHGFAPREVSISCVAADEWKRNLPADIFIDRIKSRLDKNELELAEQTVRDAAPKTRGLHHNFWDAVGLNLHAHNRMLWDEKAVSRVLPPGPPLPPPSPRK